MKNINTKQQFIDQATARLTPELVKHVEDVQDLNLDLNDFIDGVVSGIHRSAVIYGPPGLGKTHAVASALSRAGKVEGQDYIILRSHATPLELYNILWLMSAENQTIVLDDCDGITADEVGLNLLKAATDNEFRTVGWHSSKSIIDLSGNAVPSSFQFLGKIIIVTNVRLASGRGRIANHWDAVRSRVPGFSMSLATRAEQYAQVFYAITYLDYLSNHAETKLSDQQRLSLLAFLQEHMMVPRRMDLRMPQIIAREILARPDNWQRRAIRLLESA